MFIQWEKFIYDMWPYTIFFALHNKKSYFICIEHYEMSIYFFVLYNFYKGHNSCFLLSSAKVNKIKLCLQFWMEMKIMKPSQSLNLLENEMNHQTQIMCLSQCILYNMSLGNPLPLLSGDCILIQALSIIILPPK